MCGFGCGNDNGIIWIILLLCLCGNGNGCGNNGWGENSWIWIILATALATAVVPVKKLPFLWAPELYGGLSYFAEKKTEYRESSF